MTKFLLLISFLVGQVAFGQSLDSINKIVLRYGKSHNSWGHSGIYGRGEVIELSKTSNGYFIISRYFSTTSSAGKDGKTFRKDTTEIGINTDKILTKEKIQYWLTQLNTNKENFNEGFIRPQLITPTRKEIFRVAKKYDKLWMLKGRDADKENTKKAISEIQNFYQLDSFIISIRPYPTGGELIVLDVYNGLTIQTIKDKDTTEYQCQFLEPLGQPISYYAKRNFMTGKQVVNLEANTTAQNFLPMNSLVRKVLDINNIKELYIKWYLDKM